MMAVHVEYNLEKKHRRVLIAVSHQKLAVLKIKLLSRSEFRSKEMKIRSFILVAWFWF